MARIYISSTLTDLREFRVEVYKAIRRLGHLSVAMEDWAASDLPPLEERLRAVRESDVVIVLVAWRYGYIPALHHISFTELEVKTAREAGIPCLVFLVPHDTPWPPAFVDADTSRILSFRRSLLEQFVVAYFHNPEELALRVAHTLHNWTSEGASGPPAVPTLVEGAEAPGPEVFLSYAHEDAPMAESIAARLGNERWSVFWDRNIPVGLTWDDIVEAALDRAKCVVVLWSSRSRDSEWVRIEANEGAERGILAPALLEDVKIPLRFRRIQAANLIGWTPGVHEAPGLLALIGAIRRCLGPPSKNAPSADERKHAVEKTKQELLEFSGIRLFPHNQPQESKSWSEIGDGEFRRNYELDADPVFEIMAKNTVGDCVIPYRVGIRILQRIAGTGGTMGYSQPVEVQSEFTVHCPEEWKQTWGIIEKTAWAEFENPIEMKKGDSPFRFTLMLENFSDPDRASSCEVRFYLVTDKGTAESRSIWLSQ
jgi:Domain of unknown function (DUF4062)/TIR domain